MRFTVNRDSGKGRMGGRSIGKDAIDCVVSLGEAGKGDKERKLSSPEKRRRGWDRIWGAVKKEGNHESIK